MTNCSYAKKKRANIQKTTFKENNVQVNISTFSSIINDQKAKSNSFDCVGSLEQQDQNKNNQQKTKNDPQNPTNKIATSIAKESLCQVKNLESMFSYKASKATNVEKRSLNTSKKTELLIQDYFTTIPCQLPNRLNLNKITEIDYQQNPTIQGTTITTQSQILQAIKTKSNTQIPLDFESNAPHKYQL